MSYKHNNISKAQRAYLNKILKFYMIIFYTINHDHLFLFKVFNYFTLYLTFN